MAQAVSLKSADLVPRPRWRLSQLGETKSGGGMEETDLCLGFDDDGLYLDLFGDGIRVISTKTIKSVRN